MRNIISIPLALLLLMVMSGGFVYPPQEKATNPVLFQSDDLLRLKISGDIRTLLNDRSDDPQYVHMQIAELDNSAIEPYNFKAKTRGHFRLQMGDCTYPPILLNFARRFTPEQSAFHGQDKLKLTVPCRKEQDLFKEHLIYKIYNKITDYSFNVRMVEIHFIDTERDKEYDPIYGFLLEDQGLMAERLQGKILKRNGLRDKVMSKNEYLTMTVFEYFIGNTDWSIQYRHNIKLLNLPNNKLPIPVPYDFDHAGFVSASYANPSPALQLSSVRERRYRGYCMQDLTDLENILAVYQEKEAEVYQIIEDDPWLDEKTKKRVMAYVEDFYELLEKPKAIQREFLYPCQSNSTADVVIKGLRT